MGSSRRGVNYCQTTLVFMPEYCVRYFEHEHMFITYLVLRVVIKESIADVRNSKPNQRTSARSHEHLL